MYYYWDNTYILIIIGAVISMIASAKVNSTYKKFSQVASSRGITAREAARLILQSAGIMDVRIDHIRGNLTDHYSPKEKVLRLSDSVDNSTSVAAIGVAAHECGHAIQHQVGYGPLKLRSLSVPVANIGSKLSWPIIIIGIAIGLTDLAYVGVFLFSFVVLFQLVTLPVEFNASARALAILENSGMLVGDEMKGAKKVLSAAAMTYVAALFTTIMQLLRILLIIANSSDRRSRR